MNPTPAHPRSRRRRATWPLLLLVASACAEPAPEAASSEAETADPPAGTPSDAHTFDNSRERFDLPPLPHSEVHGPDADHDHIRDDVARYIDQRFADNEWARLAARQTARAYHHRLLAAADRDAARAAFDEDTYGFECLIATLGLNDAIREKRLLKAEIIDTEPRLFAYLAADDLIRGGTYRLLDDSADGCLFDREGLTP